MKTTKNTTTATTKSCFILRRYEIKASGTICADVRTSEGKEYRSCLFQDGRHSCTCKAGERGVQCYHVKHLRKSEDDRNYSRKQAAIGQRMHELAEQKQAARTQSVDETPAHPLEQNNRAESVKKVAVSAQTSQNTSTAHTEASSVIVARQVSSVERNAPAWLMRGFSGNGWMGSSR
jgi:hypothetical protein